MSRHAPISVTDTTDVLTTPFTLQHFDSGSPSRCTDPTTSAPNHPVGLIGTTAIKADSPHTAHIGDSDLTELSHALANTLLGELDGDEVLTANTATANKDVMVPVLLPLPEKFAATNMLEGYTVTSSLHVSDQQSSCSSSARTTERHGYSPLQPRRGEHFLPVCVSSTVSQVEAVLQTFKSAIIPQPALQSFAPDTFFTDTNAQSLAAVPAGLPSPSPIYSIRLQSMHSSVNNMQDTMATTASDTFNTTTALMSTPQLQATVPSGFSAGATSCSLPVEAAPLAATYNGVPAVQQRVDRDDRITVVDPQRRKLQVPLSAIDPTKALHGRLTVPSLCLLFQAGRCRQDANCYQLHADPTVIQALRLEAENQTCCCIRHGDCNEHLWDFTPTDTRSVSIAGQFAIPLTHTAFTTGLQRVLRDDRASVPVNPSAVCRLHGQCDGCRFGADCKFVHVCRSILQSELASLLAGRPSTHQSPVSRSPTLTSGTLTQGNTTTTSMSSSVFNSMVFSAVTSVVGSPPAQTSNPPLMRTQQLYWVPSSKNEIVYNNTGEAYSNGLTHCGDNGVNGPTCTGSGYNARCVPPAPVSQQRSQKYVLKSVNSDGTLTLMPVAVNPSIVGPPARR